MSEFFFRIIMAGGVLRDGQDFLYAFRAFLAKALKHTKRHFVRLPCAVTLQPFSNRGLRRHTENHRLRFIEEALAHASSDVKNDTKLLNVRIICRQ